MSWFTKSPKKTPEQDQIKAIMTEWDFQRENAISENDRKEIDAIFTRHLESIGI